VRVVGLDWGGRWVGVAVSDRMGRMAVPTCVLELSGDWQRDEEMISRKVAELEAEAVVVGLPVGMSGQLGPQAKAVLEVVFRLREVLGVPVETVDERLSTKAAVALRPPERRRGRRKPLRPDAGAAAVILQSWLERVDGGS